MSNGHNIDFAETHIKTLAISNSINKLQLPQHLKYHSHTLFLYISLSISLCHCEMSNGTRRIINQQVPSYIAIVIPIRALNARGQEMQWSIIDVFESLDFGHGYSVRKNGRTNDAYAYESLDLGHGYNVENIGRTDDAYVFDSLDLGHDYSMENNDRVFGVRPASEDSFKNLEKVTIDATTETECSICLGVLSIGLKAIRIPQPCSHVYHRDCIMRWLNIRNTCPLCRRTIPS